jgi:hypothetical protein
MSNPQCTNALVPWHYGFYRINRREVPTFENDAEARQVESGRGPLNKKKGGT